MGQLFSKRAPATDAAPAAAQRPPPAPRAAADSAARGAGSGSGSGSGSDDGAQLHCPDAAAAAAQEARDEFATGEASPARTGSGGLPKGILRPPSSEPVTLARRSHSSDGSAMRNVKFASEPSPRASGEWRRTHELAASDSVSLKKVVDVFYEKVMADPVLSPFFHEVDVPKLKSHQVQFMAMAFGGKELVLEEHPNLNLRRIHYKLIRDRGLTERHWEVFFERFKDALRELPEIPEATKSTALRSVATTRAYFVPLSDADEARYGGAGGAAGAAAAAAAAVR
ncbi:hypothetical protein Rsub_03182 [Raphidocelis subcapitata]|uniref:Globin n=1 Tax=Raphidocelis subcapitata TaxID=307507 RepID=A0A2V0NYE5_9CHLO|nr:hypothetical protein Rsub_03182 [Raphidocelis subcapitata]|eukprot:GBF90610.1 hypothetical protein Rsub_03182 [Raphidocelis subcapitata]